MKNKIVVFVPIYKIQISFNERKSLEKLLTVLPKYKLYFVHPDGLDLTTYMDSLKKYTYIEFEFHKLPTIFFNNIEGYNKLLTSLDLYLLLEDFDYFLIYQLDAFIFSDELEYWCNKEYDYIGAPWFNNFDKAEPDDKIIGVGNGGFSIRKTKTFLHILLKVKKIKYLFNFINRLDLLRKDRAIRFTKFLFQIPQGIETDFLFEENVLLNEDVFWASKIPKIFKIKVAPINDAIKFGFEVNPSVLYNMNDKKIPFGCHGWEKYEPNFWKQFIDF